MHACIQPLPLPPPKNKQGPFAPHRHPRRFRRPDGILPPHRAVARRTRAKGARTGTAEQASRRTRSKLYHQYCNSVSIWNVEENEPCEFSFARFVV
jgi:hypothetical protein